MMVMEQRKEAERELVALGFGVGCHGQQRGSSLKKSKGCWPTGSPAQVSELLTSLAEHSLVLSCTH